MDGYQVTTRSEYIMNTPIKLWSEHAPRHPQTIAVVLAVFFKILQLLYEHDEQYKYTLSSEVFRKCAGAHLQLVVMRGGAP